MALVLLAGCGNVEQDTAVGAYSIDPQFYDYVNEFEHFSGRRVMITIKFSELDGVIAGRCITGPSIIVEIDYTLWFSRDKNFRDAVMWHELGHCILGRPHNDMILPSGIPVSVMNTYVIRSEIFEANRDYYMRELMRLTNF